MGFSVFVEYLNTVLRAKSAKPVKLHSGYTGKAKSRRSAA
jgi:hypothetical protein